MFKYVKILDNQNLMVADYLTPENATALGMTVMDVEQDWQGIWRLATECVKEKPKEIVNKEQIEKLLKDKTVRLAELTKDFAQIQAGLIIDDIEDRKLEFRTLLNEVRVLQGKEPRNAINSEQLEESVQ